MFYSCVAIRIYPETALDAVGVAPTVAISFFPPTAIEPAPLSCAGNCTLVSPEIVACVIIKALSVSASVPTSNVVPMLSTSKFTAITTVF